MGQSHGRAYGITLVVVATVLWSTAGLFVRALDIDLWTMQTGRAAFGALSLFALILVDQGLRAPRAMLSVGRLGLVAIPLSAFSMFCYVAALKLTSVANVLVVYATVPFVAAAVAFLWSGERASRRTLIASAVALVGIVIMVGSAAGIDDIIGCALSFAMTIAFAVLLVMARQHPTLSMAAVNAAGAALCAFAGWLFAPFVMPGGADLAILAAFGVVTTGLAYLLFLTGGRYIPSSEAGLIAILDVVLGPIWVWLVFAENPGTPAIVGGTIVIGALVWYLSSGPRGAAAPPVV